MQLNDAEFNEVSKGAYLIPSVQIVQIKHYLNFVILDCQNNTMITPKVIANWLLL